MSVNVEGYDIDVTEHNGRLRTTIDDGKGHKMVMDSDTSTPRDVLFRYALEEITHTRERRAGMTERELKDEHDRLAARAKGG